MGIPSTGTPLAQPEQGEGDATASPAPCVLARITRSLRPSDTRDKPRR